MMLPQVISSEDCSEILDTPAVVFHSDLLDFLLQITADRTVPVNGTISENVASIVMNVYFQSVLFGFAPEGSEENMMTVQRINACTASAAQIASITVRLNYTFSHGFLRHVLPPKCRQGLALA